MPKDVSTSLDTNGFEMMQIYGAALYPLSGSLRPLGANLHLSGVNTNGLFTLFHHSE